ncbi:MAG: flagellar basal body rod protein FlgC [Treponema sp.]|nr:flagellar basal body rod protein FlgC [Treponema sp.]MCL2251002.1 flagellar basal body rod protein FlgC [Treponema sp.]
MGIFGSMNIAATGLSANRLRLDVISDNMANVNTTRTNEGGPYKRSRVIMRPMVSSPYWRSPFLPESMDNGLGKGVRVAEVQKDTSTEPRFIYDPTHPDAMLSGPREGYVEMPNVDVVTEMVDMISASRSYEANAAIIEGAKAMFQRALDIGAR